MAPLTNVMMEMRGLTCQPALMSVCMRGLYLAGFSLRAIFENMSWQQVYSMNCMVCDGVGLKWGWLYVVAPSTHNMYGLNLVGHVHDVVGHVHWSDHCRIVLSCGLEFWSPTFTSV